MEEKISVNEYVRTKDGYIIRVDENTNIFNLGYKEQYIDMETTRYGFTCEEEIVKHSKQLIDLIEVGDFVNGMEVLDIHKPRDLWEPIEIRVDSRYTNFILAEDIKKILTKEQFEANCYKVGGEDDEL